MAIVRDAVIVGLALLFALAATYAVSESFKRAPVQTMMMLQAWE